MKTYYVDPAVGDDGHDGSGRDTAWRSFAPLAAVLLGPGDHVEILAPGAFDQTLVLGGGGTPESPVTVHFAPGRYDFHPTHAQKRRYDISNCNDDAAGEKAIAILVEHARHIEISGPGACMVCRGKMIEVCIDHSESITLSDLAFDYHRPTVSEFSVTAVAADYADLSVHPDSAYAIEDARLHWLGEGWRHEGGLTQELVPETDEVWRRRDPLKGLRIEELAPYRLRAHGAHDMVAGRVYQVRNPFRDCAGVFANCSREVTFLSVDFRFLHGMGLLFQFTQDITLDAVRIAPEEGSGRTTAAWADCMHFSGCRGRIVIRNCLFCGAHDDAVNVHGTHLRIVGQVGERQVRVRFMHRQTYGFLAFHPGDEIEFVRWATLAPFAVNRVTAVTRVEPRELLLTLEQPVPVDWQTDDVIENATWTPEVEISGCTVKRIPTRGFLLTTRRPVVVHGNTFIRTRIGILVEHDAEGWFESGCVRDMTIRGNRFVECRRAAVCINPHNSQPNAAVHRNIRIVENEMIVPEGDCAVEASSTTGLTITGNRIQTSCADLASMFKVVNCAEVICEKNQEPAPWLVEQ
jgi:hypothetical protein